MRTSLVVARLSAPFLGVLALGLATVNDPAPADAAPSRCTAEVLIHEDDSYSKLALSVDGREIAQAWDVTAPRFQGTTWLRRSGHAPRGEVVANVDWSAAGPVWRGLPCAVLPVRS